MALKNQVIKVTGDDWTGIYIDGRLRAQGHSIPFSELMEALEEYTTHKINFWEELEADIEWLEGEGYLPDTLAEVKFDANCMVPAGLIWN